MPRILNQPLTFFCACLTLAAQPPTERAVAAVLDDWHLAAAQADEGRYFSHLAAGAVFLGTDPSERWTKAAFQVWAHPIFQRGKAWSFQATRRAITLSRDGRTAWFDEDLDTPHLGPARGTGVLTREGDRWLIQLYNLSIPIPNDLMTQVKALIDTQAVPKKK